MYDILQLNDMLVPELKEIAEKLEIANYKKLAKQDFIKFEPSKPYGEGQRKALIQKLPMKKLRPMKFLRTKIIFAIKESDCKNQLQVLM